MKIFMFLFLTNPVFASEIRSEIVEPTRQFLEGQTPPVELVQKIKHETKNEALNEEERLYLVDLTKRLPEGVRDELCPSLETGLCAEAPGFDIWEEVPKLETSQSPSQDSSPTFWQKPSTWIALGLVGLAGAAAFHLKDKELQVQGFR